MTLRRLVAVLAVLVLAALIAVVWDQVAATWTAEPNTVYLEDLPVASASEPTDTQRTATINDQSYLHSQGAEFCFGDVDRIWVYDLGQAFTTFHAVIGLDDISDAGTVVRYEVLTDDRPVYAQEVRLGQSFGVKVPVANVHQLKLVTTLTSSAGTCGDSLAQWGEARLDGVPR